MSTDVSKQDRYELDRLDACLKNCFAQATLHYVEQTTSTNDWGMRLPLSMDESATGQSGSAPESACLLLTDKQTAGRGRQGRDWSSPSGGDIYMSLVLDGHFPIATAAVLPLAVGLAVRRALQPQLSKKIWLKWPNDLICEDLKLAGILCEARLAESHVRRFVLGLGLNVQRRSFEPELEKIACSLRQIDAGQTWSRTAIICSVLCELAALWPACLRQDAQLLRDYTAVCLNIGRRVKALGLDGRSLVGMAEALDAQGALLVRDDEGQLHKIQSGEVSLSATNSPQV